MKTDTYLLAKYPMVYKGTYAEVYNMSAEIPHTAFAYWRNFFRLDDPQFHEDMSQTVRLIADLDLKVYISDHSGLEVVTQDVLDWLHPNWYKKAYENGLIIEACIDASTIFAQITLAKMIDNSKTQGIQAIKYPDFLTAKTSIAEYVSKEILAEKTL